MLFLGRGNTVNEESLWEQLRSGMGGFKVHEDWGATPAVIGTALRVADAGGVQVAIHSDSLNEAEFVEDLLRTVDGRTFHAFHTEGAGGGHAPDIIRIAGEPYVLPSSTTPTRPFTVNTADEQLDICLIAHHLNPRVPAELAFAESRVRASTMAAEDILQDMGAISAMTSDAQAMGRLTPPSWRFPAEAYWSAPWPRRRRPCGGRSTTPWPTSSHGQPNRDLLLRTANPLGT